MKKTSFDKPLKRHLITIYPDMISGEPAIDHHRIEAMQFAEAWWYSSLSLKFVEQNWPGIDRGAVLVCCWYAARYGTRLWRKRWGEWLKIADGELWKGNYKTCTMPPQKGDAQGVM